jgi:hypothetical protein
MAVVKEKVDAQEMTVKSTNVKGDKNYKMHLCDSCEHTIRDQLEDMRRVARESKLGTEKCLDRCSTCYIKNCQWREKTPYIVHDLEGLRVTHPMCRCTPVVTEFEACSQCEKRHGCSKRRRL